METAVLPRLDSLRAGSGRRGTDLDRAIRSYARVAVRQGHLDSVVTEAVRLRCARVHDCRLCQSLRLGDSLEAGFDEEASAAIDRYETSDLPHRVKVALRLTDAMIFTPVGVSPELRAELLECFSPEEVIEIVFDIVKWSSQKSLVALRMEPPLEGRNVLAFDEIGDHVLS
ncbi:carboxymuconolactone decarboxylase family protein [Nocardioides houyundeii]|uniref:carboxymuconolactone decarboxylase family protein n=1 Tax=Nocardioides houyundeii TaxID=2045452 RepID=UPI000C77A520|nr:carboxymuconolactone decarboxylase family protein [Nocardioides houyundeii]